MHQRPRAGHHLGYVAPIVIRSEFFFGHHQPPFGVPSTSKNGPNKCLGHGLGVLLFVIPHFGSFCGANHTVTHVQVADLLDVALVKCMYWLLGFFAVLAATFEVGCLYV